MDAAEDISSGCREFVAEVARYYRDFLETDFKKSRAPSRQVRIRDEHGNSFGFNIRRYPELQLAIAKLLEAPIEGQADLAIKRNQFTAGVSRNIQELLNVQIDKLDPEAVRSALNSSVIRLKRMSVDGKADFDRFVDDAQEVIAANLMSAVISPLLETIENALASSPKASDLLYEIDDDIEEHIVSAVQENLPRALVELTENDDISPLAKLLHDEIGPAALLDFLHDFFSNLATGDAYEELLEVAHTLRANETLELYFYWLDLIHGSHQFPVCYIPIRLEKEADKFVVKFDNRLFINRRALKYVVDKNPEAGMRIPGKPTNDRIHFLDEESPLSLLESVFLALSDAYNLSENISVSGKDLHYAANSTLKVTNAIHFCVFSKDEEAIVNDYEQILVQANDESSPLNALFESLISGCILSEPTSERRVVQESWDDTPKEARLVFESPVPLNEEQRKLLIALQNPSVRFAVVEGPPGTGKSHTITAIVFDAIMREKSVLVLSDKMEALDVVEDKLSQTLSGVRPGSDFQNPILRLGRSSGTYAKILQKSSLEKIRQYSIASRSHRATAREDLNRQSRQAKEKVRDSIDFLSAVSMQEIVQYESLLAELGIVETAGIGLSDKSIPRVKALVELLESQPTENRLELLGLAKQFPAADKLLLSISQKKLESEFSASFGADIELLKQFERIPVEHIDWLGQITADFEEMRTPLFGFLFKKAEVTEAAEQFRQKMPVVGVLPPHKRYKKLLLAGRFLKSLRDSWFKEGLSESHMQASIDLLMHEPVISVLGDEDKALVGRHQDAVDGATGLLEVFWGDRSDLAGILEMYSTKKSQLATFIEMLDLHSKLSNEFDRIPDLDFQKSQNELQEEYAADLANKLDENLIEFVDENNALATTLKEVIRQRKPFPKERFNQLKKAFPCMIAGIREFADYIPLEPDLIDILVIDEASQVSIAQAFPAILRAKQVLVLGDEKQFANVKTTNASKSVNHSYMADLQEVFTSKFAPDAEKLERMRSFDVRTSILRFGDLIKNFEVMLKKHFRGYAELISFSSKTFYSGGLQAIRIRAIPIDEVIRFTVVDKEKFSDVNYRNANISESKFIEGELEELLELGEPPSVGIITPFREQQKLLAHELLFKSDYSSDFQERLSLKIMTFDSCQGEERDLIFYSLVATDDHDRLNYVFPTKIQNWQEGNEQLKAQRLNVGFSRAKETMHFVLSKPPQEFRGSIREVLRHYEKQKESARRLPEADQVDPASPMEAKVLEWLKQSAFYVENFDRLEIIPQFPLGDYLKQLDPLYTHPSYRVDFLLLFTHSSGSKVPIIIEYDGFREHFVPGAPVDETNYEHYYKKEDVERQFVLESYGYNFIRVNRFNLGNDPTQTLSERLYRLVELRLDKSNNEKIEAISNLLEKIASGESKTCPKCGQILPVDSFKRANLKSGVGRVCNSCRRS